MSGGLQNLARNNNIDVDGSVDSSPYKRRRDKIKDGDDTQPPSKKPHHIGEDLERTASTVLQTRRDPQRTANSSCATVSQSLDCFQAGPHGIHRPFETASSVGRSKTDTDTDRQPDDERRDVTSWADCLRQLAIALRRRQDNDDSGQAAVGPVAVQTPSGVRSLDQKTKNDDPCPPDRKQRHYDCDADVVQPNRLESVNDEDHRDVCSSSSNNNNNNLPASKFDPPSAAEYSRSIDNLRCSLSFNAAAVQGHLCPGLFWHARTLSNTCINVYKRFFYFVPTFVYFKCENNGNF